MKTIRNKSAFTTPSIWVCMIGDEFLVENGIAACDTEEGIENMFKSSNYWKQILLEYNSKQSNKENAENSIEEKLYKKLLIEETIKYFEIKPTNN